MFLWQRFTGNQERTCDSDIFKIHCCQSRWGLVLLSNLQRQKQLISDSANVNMRPAWCFRTALHASTIKSSDPYIYSRKLSFFIAERPQSSSSMGNMLLTKNECCYLQSELPTYHSSELTSAGVYVENTRDFPMKLPGFKTWQPV